MFLYVISWAVCAIMGGCVGEFIGFTLANVTKRDLLKYSILGRVGGAVFAVDAFTNPVYNSIVESLKVSLAN